MRLFRLVAYFLIGNPTSIITVTLSLSISIAESAPAVIRSVPRYGSMSSLNFSSIFALRFSMCIFYGKEDIFYTNSGNGSRLL